MPSCYEGIQTAVLKILPVDESRTVLDCDLFDKCLITYPVELCSILNKQVDWFPNLEELFKSTNSFLRMCWLKAIGGAWTTTTRMHELRNWPCVLGCIDCQDEIRHYMQCPFLWRLAREALTISEEHISLGHRLRFIDCSVYKLRLLAYTYLCTMLSKTTVSVSTSPG